MISNEQRAHEFALKYAELKSKICTEPNRSNYIFDSDPFADLYIEAYKIMLVKLTG